MGLTLTWLSVIILIPLAGLFLKTLELSPGQFWDILTSRPLNEAGIADSDYRAIDQFWKRQFLDYVRRRPLDFVARYGGEELVAVLYGADKSYGESIARGLLAAVRELRIPHAASETQPYVTVSVGIVAIDAYRMASHDAAIELADQALYAAKHQGRDRYVIAEHPQTPRVDPAATTVLPLREAAGS